MSQDRNLVSELLISRLVNKRRVNRCSLVVCVVCCFFRLELVFVLIFCDSIDFVMIGFDFFLQMDPSAAVKLSEK